MILSYFTIARIAFTFVIVKIIAIALSTIDSEFSLIKLAVIEFKLLLEGNLKLI